MAPTTIPLMASHAGAAGHGRLKLMSSPASLNATTAPFTSIEEALGDIRAGRMIVVVDDPGRENEGDLTMAAEHVTPAAINFMARHGRGLICAALTEERLAALRIPLMTADNTSNFGTAFCESVDARHGVSTGISAADRAFTIQALVDERSAATDFARPGHVFPLRARAGGVLARAGQTEAAVDLARLAGLQPAGIICEIMNEDGSMARVPELADFVRLHGLKMITVADLIRHRLAHERHVERIGESAHATSYGLCRLIAYRNQLDGQAHSALVFGDVAGAAPVLVRVQRHCLPGALGSAECRCARNLDSALRQLQQAGRGILVYLHHSGPGYALGVGGEVQHGPAEPESEIRRQTGLGAQILQDLGARELLVLTDHPRPLAGLEAYGLHVAGCAPLRTE